MFEGEAYRSYIALCRELRLRRTEFKPGDWCTFDVGGGSSGAYLIDYDDESANTEFVHPRNGGYYVWLPRLDQWLAMLEEAGVPNVGFWAGNDHARYAKCGVLLQASVYEGWDFGDLETAPTREEAAARLWCAVTGRTVG